MNRGFQSSYAETVVVCQSFLNGLCCTADAAQTHKAELQTSVGKQNNDYVSIVFCSTVSDTYRVVMNLQGCVWKSPPVLPPRRPSTAASKNETPSGIKNMSYLTVV